MESLGHHSGTNVLDEGYYGFMKAIAFICAYNEADIIGWTVRHLRRQGLAVHVIDCQSTDNTVRVACEAGATCESYCAPPVSWHTLLQRVELCAQRSGYWYDWCVHCDADEIRYSPIWSTAGESLLEGFARVQAEGYNAINHHVLTFHPTDNGFDGTQDPEQYFRYYESDVFNQKIGQVKAWRNLGPVELAASGGHRVWFRGIKIHPVPFLSKHYPIRSQHHGERKVFQERKWLDPEQGRKNWHVQYDGIHAGDSFLKDPAKFRLNLFHCFPFAILLMALRILRLAWRDA
jgi:glycosyltransferase involved in cell wall biosynthesis